MFAYPVTYPDDELFVPTNVRAVVRGEGRQIIKAVSLDPKWTILSPEDKLYLDYGHLVQRTYLLSGHTYSREQSDWHTDPGAWGVEGITIEDYSNKYKREVHDMVFRVPTSVYKPRIPENPNLEAGDTDEE